MTLAAQSEADELRAWNEGSFDAGYRQMAEDEARETKALALVESTIGDLSDMRGENWRLNFDRLIGG